MKKVLSVIIICLFSLTMFTACGGNTGITDEPIPMGTVGESPEAQTSPASASSFGSEEDTIGTDEDPAPVEDEFDQSRVIAVFTREDGSGTRDAFVSLTGIGEDMYAEAIVESETNQILTKVEDNEYAISYVSVGSLNPKVKALPINGVAPSDATITDGSYTLQRPFVLCVNGDNKGNKLVQDFISFILSAEGQEIVGTKWTKIDTNAPDYSPGGLSGTLKVGGSTSVEPLMQSLSEAYKALNPGIDIEISGGGSGTGISEATDGVLNIGMSSRALKDTEMEALEDYNIALDGVAVIVNPANPITSITIDQVKDIFTGEVTRWTDVG